MRINRAIDLLKRGEVLYYTNPGELTEENGRRQAATWADILLVDFEHEAFDVVGLTAFMRGLAAGGPTADGYRTPTVIATLPSNCRTVDEVRANAWQVRQVLTAGVHGILHTHARSADAVAAFVAETRYAGTGIRETATGDNPNPRFSPQRGAGGQARPAAIWGVSPIDYMRLADPWPLNPDGELLLGVKIEDRECLANACEVAAMPGLAFAEWGPGDMGLSFGYPDAHDPPYPPELESARQTVKAACDKAEIAFLSSWNDPTQTIEENIRYLLDWGVRIVSPGPQGEEWARVGRGIR
ncbi:MAG: aldolase/citrate lyase family protein [Chloroflexota bacterium]|nr:aldolase/citrate lyase family protein [Chloroflexota bacterium]